MTRPLPDDKRTKPYVERNSPWQPTPRQLKVIAEDWSPATELAKRFGVHPHTVRRWRRKLKCSAQSAPTPAA